MTIPYVRLVQSTSLRVTSVESSTVVFSASDAFSILFILVGEIINAKSGMLIAMLAFVVVVIQCAS